MWSAVRLTTIQSTARPHHVWPKVWTKIGKAAQNREKQEWAEEKPKPEESSNGTWMGTSTKLGMYVCSS